MPPPPSYNQGTFREAGNFDEINEKKRIKMAEKRQQEPRITADEEDKDKKTS